MLLAADIGGTKSHLALFEEQDGILKVRRDQIYTSPGFAVPELILEDFLDESDISTLQAVCFGVAGPVRKGRCVTTNLPWTLDEHALSAALGGAPVFLINDLVAAALGLLRLGAEDFAVLHQGSEPWAQGNIAVIAAGTGLGEACLCWDGSAFQPLASEGGNVDYAPVTPVEIDLLEYLGARYGGHVSYERVVSGAGLRDIYDFFRDVRGYKEPDWLQEEVSQDDRAAAISRIGLEGRSPLCEAAVELFASAYGRAAGNLALKFLSYGGVAIAGGIAPKILPALQRPEFMAAFLDKGRYADLLKGMEVRVVLNEQAGLIGAGYFAQKQLEKIT